MSKLTPLQFELIIRQQFREQAKRKEAGKVEEWLHSALFGATISKNLVMPMGSIESDEARKVIRKFDKQVNAWHDSL